MDMLPRQFCPRGGDSTPLPKNEVVLQINSLRFDIVVSSYHPKVNSYISVIPATTGHDLTPMGLSKPFINKH